MCVHTYQIIKNINLASKTMMQKVVIYWSYWGQKKTCHPY